MADFYMHSRLVKNVIQELHNPINEKIAILGSQGPDPKYYKIFGKNQAKYREIADDVHRYKVSEFLTSMTTYVKQNLSTITYSYLVGYITHFSMDVHIHPYVYYNVGVFHKEKPETHSYRGLHLKFERAIDSLLIKKDLGIPAHRLNLNKTCFPLKEAPIEVCNIHEHALKEVFNVDDGGLYYKNGVKSMYNVLKYMNTDRFGIKKQIYKFVDLFSKDSDMFLKDLSFYHNLEDVDYHNDQQKVWRHPLTNDEYNYNIDDLFAQAKEFSMNIMKEVDAYLYQNKDIDFKEVFPNISYNTGKDCTLGMDFKYLNVYKK